MAAVLTAKAIVQCAHLGLLTFTPSQTVLAVGGDAVLVGDDVLHATIACPNTPKPCSKVNTIDGGLSTTLRIGDGQAVLENAHGTTDVATWQVVSAGQRKLEAA
jgi:hypothetical protein